MFLFNANIMGYLNRNNQVFGCKIFFPEIEYIKYIYFFFNENKRYRFSLKKKTLVFEHACAIH